MWRWKLRLLPYETNATRAVKWYRNMFSELALRELAFSSVFFCPCCLFFNSNSVCRSDTYGMVFFPSHGFHWKWDSLHNQCYLKVSAFLVLSHMTLAVSVVPDSGLNPLLILSGNPYDSSWTFWLILNVSIDDPRQFSSVIPRTLQVDLRPISRQQH